MKKYLWLFIIGLLLQSCARVGSPVGGDKDTIPPQFLGANIDTTRVNVPVDIRELRLEFDEYVKLKDIQKNLIISPPIKKIKRIVPSNLATKYVLIQFEDTLQDNTTYQFNFGNSIQDNNESNPLRYFNFAFSTGEKIDENYISGEVSDAFDIEKKTSTNNKNVVGLYKHADSINYKEKPYYISRVEDDGYFELEYITPGKYQLIAFSDDNENSIYDEGKEKIGFIKEPLEVKESISGMKLTLSPSQKKVKYVEAKSTEGGLLMLFEGHPKQVEVEQVDRSLGDIKVSHKKYSDSVMVWVKPYTEEQKKSKRVRLVYKTPEKTDTISTYYEQEKDVEMNIKSDIAKKLPPKSDFTFISNFEIDKIYHEQWGLKKDSTEVVSFQAEIDKNNPYRVLVKANFEGGKKYQLTVPKESVVSYYAKTNKSYRFDFESDILDNYGSATFRLTNKPSFKFWIQILDYAKNVKYQQYTDESEIKFQLLPKGEYYIRILADDNENEFWDAASLEKMEFAEKSYLFYKTLNVRPLWEIVEDWDLNSTQKLQRVIPSPIKEEEVQEVKNIEKEELFNQNRNNFPVGGGFERNTN